MFRVLNDKDFLDLLRLYIEMYKTIAPHYTNSYVSIILAEEMKQDRFIAYGVFQGDTLIGFITGYAIRETEFFNSGLYCESKIKVKNLIKSFELWLISRGYTSWSTEAKGHIKSLAYKFGAIVENIRYKKEL
jgi:hypothetical protein